MKLWNHIFYCPLVYIYTDGARDRYRLNRDSSLVTYICYLLIRLIHDNINKIKISYKYKKEVRKLAFGDNGPRKKTPFEKLTLIVVIIMVLVTVGALVLSALSAVI